jgi:alkylation response protein AidB-like acyl-CoA dehydrogenase
MLFELTTEQQMIQAMVREFARNEIEPYAEKFDREKIFPKEVIKKMGELGLMGMMIPERYGGSGAGSVSYSLAVQEISYSCASCGVIMSVNNLSCEPIFKFGNEEQKEKFLTPLASGKYLGSFAITEPNAGSDVSSIRTSAKIKNEYYIINGTKSFITNGAYADIIVLTARTQEGTGNKGLTTFIVEKSRKGLSVGTFEDKMGLRGSNTVELIFEECRIPKENLIGNEGDGFKIAMNALDSGRIGIASQAIGIAKAALDESIKYSKMRKQFGKTISNFQGIQWMIADMATEIEAAYLLTLYACSLKDSGKNYTKEASQAKLFATEMANRVVYKAVQIHGGYGYIKGYKVERLYRDARVTTIYEGTSEIQKIVIAKNILK